MRYESECWVVDSKIDQMMSIVEMKILRYMTGVTNEDQNMRNEYKNKHYRSGSNNR